MPLGIGCSARPGQSLGNRTGSWRVFRPRFLHEKCTQCGTCQLICPEACVQEIEDGKFEPDYNYCKGCGLCANECPVEDIVMEQEEK